MLIVILVQVAAAGRILCLAWHATDEDLSRAKRAATPSGKDLGKLAEVMRKWKSYI